MGDPPLPDAGRSRATAGAEVDWARLAADLGGSDQAHFYYDFVANVEVTPSRYTRLCADTNPTLTRRLPGPDTNVPLCQG